MTQQQHQQHQNQSTPQSIQDATAQQQHAQQQQQHQHQQRQQQLQMDHIQRQIQFRQKALNTIVQCEGTAGFLRQQLAHSAHLASAHMVPMGSETDSASFGGGGTSIYPPDTTMNDVPNSSLMPQPLAGNNSGNNINHGADLWAQGAPTRTQAIPGQLDLLPFEDTNTTTSNDNSNNTRLELEHVNLIPPLNLNDMQQAVSIFASPDCSFQDTLATGSSTGTHSIVNTPTPNQSFPNNSHGSSYFSLPLPLHGSTLVNFLAQQQQQQHHHNDDDDDSMHRLAVPPGAAGLHMTQVNVTPEMPSLTLQGSWASHPLESRLLQQQSASIPQTPPPSFFHHPSQQSLHHLTSLPHGLPSVAAAVTTPVGHASFPAPPPPAPAAVEMPPTRPAAAVPNVPSSSSKQNPFSDYNKTYLDNAPFPFGAHNHAVLG
ncbi:hypothetical protein BGZ47_006517 [Haplosporangium gracile]|nr:hypothetical protein BGZ47_006517 [Haplosporangium gracile]